MTNPTTSDRPIEGKTVLITRAKDQAAEAEKRLKALGATTLVQPAIKILPPSSWDEVDQIISRVEEFSILAFVSTNAVRHFVARCEELGQLERFHQVVAKFGILMGAIGQSTGEALLSAGITVGLTPERSNSESLAEAILLEARSRTEAKSNQSSDLNVLIVRADRGSEVLRGRLGDSQDPIEITELAVYRNVDEKEVEPNVLAQLQAGKVDWVTVTSSAIAKSVHRLLGADLGRAKVVSISPTTTAAAREVGLRVDAEAKTYNMAGVIDAIVRFETSAK